MGIEGPVGEETVIAKRDGETCADEHRHEEGNLKSIEAKVPNIKGNGREGKEEGAGEERAIDPIYVVKRDVAKDPGCTRLISGLDGLAGFCRKITGMRLHI